MNVPPKILHVFQSYSSCLVEARKMIESLIAIDNDVNYEYDVKALQISIMNEDHEVIEVHKFTSITKDEDRLNFGGIILSDVIYDDVSLCSDKTKAFLQSRIRYVCE